MNELEERLRYLVAEACKHQPGSLERQKNLTAIVRLISSRLWKENVPYYEDALQQTWIYFCKHICEAGAGEAYDPDRSSVATWLNVYLKRRLQDLYIDRRERELRTKTGQAQSLSSGAKSEIVDPVDNIAATPDVPPLLEDVKRWAESDANGELRRTCIAGRPEVNARVLILRRLPPETGWKTLSAEFGLPVSTLSSFYQRQCMPRLRKFGESEGYI